MSRGHLGDGDELEQFVEQHIAVDRDIQQLWSDAPLSTSALGLTACQLQQPAGEELQDCCQEDRHCFTQPPGMAALPQTVFHQAHGKDQLGSGGAGATVAR